MSFQGNEFSSFKLLIKQVYFAHTSKVKELENEVKTLKEQLAIKIKETKDALDCKRCEELETAFKSCKKALQEQSKLFDSFGKKFSIFNDVEKGNLNLKSFSSSWETNPNADENFTASILDESSTLLPKQDILSPESKTSSNKNLLKNIINDKTDDVHNMSSVESEALNKGKPFSKKCDETVFAPDSVEMDLDCKKGVKRRSTDCFSEDDETKIPANKDSKKNQMKEPEVIMLSSNSSCDSKERKLHKHVKPITAKKESLDKDFSVKDKNSLGTKHIDETSPKCIDNVCPKTKNVEINVKVSEASKAITSKEKKNITPKSSFLLNNNDKFNQITSPYETSPSLLPKVNEALKKVDLKAVETDDDFVEIGSSTSKSNACTAVSAKPKAPKKARSLIKCTSKYKMTLDALPLNYRKPNYKQSKLSKTFFQGKKKEENSHDETQDSNSREANEAIPTIVLDENLTSAPKDLSKPEDFDATFIPENYERNVSSFVTTNVEKNAAKISNLRNGSLFSNISFFEDVKPKLLNSEPCENDIENSPSADESDSKENMNSFDRLPVPEEPKYKYKNNAVRKKADRKQLAGFDCEECRKYYSGLGLSEKEMKERMKKCSRHRAKFAPPPTPDHFWELDFPDTEECKNRGYMDQTQKVKLSELAS